MFGTPQKIYEPIKNLAERASEGYQDLVNCYFRHNPESPDNQETEVIKTKGFAQYGTAVFVPIANPGLGLSGFTPSVGTYGAVYAAWDDGTPDTQIYRYTSSVADPVSAGATGRFATNGNTVEFEQAFDNQYATNGVDSVLLQTGSTGVWSTPAPGAPLSGAGTVAKYLCFHNYMMFAARTVNAPNKMYVSDPGTPGTFTGPVTRDFRHEIVGLKSLDSYLMIYTKKEIWACTGTIPASLAYRLVSDQHPCVSHRSIVSVIGGAREYSATGVQSNVTEHWYLASDYVWATNGSTFRILGKESWEGYRENLNPTRLSQAAAKFDQTTGQYLLSVCTGANTANNVTWAYDPIADKWIEKPFYTASAWTTYGSPTPELYFQDSAATGKTYIANSGNGVQSQKTTLNGALTSTALYAVVGSTTGFPTSGVIQVDNEAIAYQTVTGTKFGDNASGANQSILTRGYCGTTPADHTTGTVVYPAMQFRYRTRNLYLNATNLIKKFKILWLNVMPSVINYFLQVNVDIDQQGYSTAKNIQLGTSGMVWGTDVWGSATWGSPSILLTPDNRAPLSGTGKSIKISLDETTSIQQTEITEMELLLRPKKKK